jgi:hypothetical protein
MIRSLGGNAAHSARHSVVFPAPCAPDTTIDSPARTTAPRKLAASGVRVPFAIRSSKSTSTMPCRRMVTIGRSVTQANAANRADSPNGRFISGVAGLNGRGCSLEREAQNCRSAISSSSLSATAGPSHMVPSFNSMCTTSQPCSSMFSIHFESISGWSRPKPNSASNTARRIFPAFASSGCSPMRISSAIIRSTSSAITRRPSACSSSSVEFAVRCSAIALVAAIRSALICAQSRSD